MSAYDLAPLPAPHLPDPAMRLRRARPLLALAAPGLATAAAPNADRPSFSRTGFLVVEDTVEMEGGFNWAPDAPSGSLLPKVGLGRFEPRVGVDLYPGGATFTPGTKVGIVQKEGLGLAGQAHVQVPTGGGGTVGEAGGALTGVLAGGQVLQANLGVRTSISSNGVAVVDTPLAALVGIPVGGFSMFGEAVVLLGQDSPWLLNAGFGVNLTKSLVLDGALGWTVGSETLSATAGITANFGELL